MDLSKTHRQIRVAVVAVHILGSLVFLGQGCSSSKKAEGARVYVSVQEFEPRAGVTQSVAHKTSARFEDLLRQSGRFVVVDRKQFLKKGIPERSSGSATEEKKVSENAEILLARKFVYGTVGKIGVQSYSVSIKLVDVETSSVDVAVSKTYNGNLERLSDDFLSSIVSEILSVIDKQSVK